MRGSGGERNQDYSGAVATGPQQRAPRWRGGHGWLPWEQNTQQSPGAGSSTRPQPGQSKNQAHASPGIAIDAP